VHNACANAGLPLRRKLTVNLSPANLPKHGTGLDVAIAIAALATEADMDATSPGTTAHIGELGLDGRLRPVPGVLPAVAAAARAGIRRVVVPHANRAEAELVAGVEVVGASRSVMSRAGTGSSSSRSTSTRRRRLLSRSQRGGDRRRPRPR
jgi:magnesium chelatase family protein